MMKKIGTSGSKRSKGPGALLNLLYCLSDRCVYLQQESTVDTPPWCLIAQNGKFRGCLLMLSLPAGNREAFFKRLYWRSLRNVFSAELQEVPSCFYLGALAWVYKTLTAAGKRSRGLAGDSNAERMGWTRWRLHIKTRQAAWLERRNCQKLTAQWYVYHKYGNQVEASFSLVQALYANVSEMCARIQSWI
jgi:hypothetical protein